MILERHEVLPKVPGTALSLSVLRFGTPGARPKAYVQAGLHADEVPGMLTAHHLRDRLSRLDADGLMKGEVVLVPIANPVGLGQTLFGSAQGRFDLGDGQNFNRGFPSLTEAAVARVGDTLGDDPAANVALVRDALGKVLAEWPARTTTQALKKALLELAIDADFVLDLHCDGEAQAHLYTHTVSSDLFAPLAARLGCVAVLTAEVSGGEPFDEALSRPWAELAMAFPAHSIPQACASTTVELRGRTDVTHAFATADADAIIAFLGDVGVVHEQRSAIPEDRPAPTPLDGAEALEAPCSGILVYCVETGTRVEQGQPIAEIIDPVSGVEMVLAASGPGIFFARTSQRFVVAGQRVGKIAGTTLKRTGALLSP